MATLAASLLAASLSFMPLKMVIIAMMEKKKKKTFFVQLYPGSLVIGQHFWFRRYF